MEFIWEVVKNLFTVKAFLLHPYYYLWKTELVRLQLVSGALISFASDSIFITPIYFVRKHIDWHCDYRKNLVYFTFQLQDTSKRNLQEKLSGRVNTLAINPEGQH